MTGRRVVGAIVVVLAVAAAGWAVRRPVARWFETPPSLGVAVRQADAGDYDAAESSLTRFLARHPDHREANLLMARVAIDRPQPKPAVALACLDKVRSRDPRSRSVVLTQRGKALYLQSRLAESEAAWVEAMTLNPDVPEAGWLRIQQYYLQGRDDEARRLALSLWPRETDPFDRVRYLLELVREDVERLSAAGVIQWLEPAVKADPKDRASAVGLGRALVKEGRTEEGFRLLRAAVAERPDDPAGWDTLLGALGDAGDVEGLAAELAKVPAALATDPRLAAHRGRLAQEQRRFPDAVREFETALKARPDDARLVYRLARVLSLAGRPDDAKPYAQREAELNAAQKELKAAYDEAAALKTLGPTPEPRLYQRFADLRERVGKPDEAAAWHRLVLRDDPENPTSRAALARLEPPVTPRSGG